MKNLICLASVMIVFGALAESMDYGLMSKGWEVTPDAAAEIAALRAADKYQPHRAHPRLFVRTQLKYGLERGDYLHKWYDRPLLGDVRYQAANEKGHFINVETWRRMAELGKLCGHGFSTFTICSGRDDIIPRSVLPGAEADVLVEITGDNSFEEGRHIKKKGDHLSKCLMRIEEALKMPNAFRVNGKLVITSYPAIRIDKLGFYAALSKEIKLRWGDQVALMPYFSPFGQERQTPFDKAELARTQDNLRAALRAVDGLCFSTETVLSFNRRVNPKFALEVAVPLIHGVLSEPEFKDKLLGMTVSCGHENCYRWNYAKDCTGTRRLRDNLAVVRALRPDFINATEWDEENENTHHRPTIAQGFVQQRLMRYATTLLEGRAQEMYPGDDATIPNLVISYRKSLLAGEPIEVEVLNIPDGTFRGETFTVQFAWRNAAGEVVKSYPAQALGADVLEAAWFTTPVTELLAEPLLQPELIVKQGTNQKTWSKGLWPVSLHVNRNLEFRWVKQALREKTAGVDSALTVSAAAADGTVEVKGFVASPAELRSVEVLDGPDTVYLHDPAAPTRDADGALAVRIAWQGLPFNASERPTGTIRLEGAPQTKLAIDGVKLRNATLKKQKITFKNASIQSWAQIVYADIPATELESAEFVVDVPPYFVGRVKAKDLLEKDIISFPAAGGMNLVFRRWLSARRLTPPCGGTRADFAFRMKPTSPDSVLRLQTVDAKFHVDYGASQAFFRPSGQSVSVTAFERDAETVSTASVDANRLVSFDYTFSPARGGVVSSGAALGLDGILCGYMPLVCGYGSGESGYGNMTLESGFNAKAKGWPNTVGEYVPEAEGRYSLKFKDCSFVTLPQQVVPEYAGFTLELEVNPDEVTRQQGLFASGNAYCNLWIEKGRVWANLFLRNGYMHANDRADRLIAGPEIKAGEWSTVKLIWDRRTCRIDVNGVAGTPVVLSGDLFYARHSALGTLRGNDTFFAGKMRRVRCTPQVK